MSSAYDRIKHPLWCKHMLLKSSKYTANKKGDKTEPCLTPNAKLKAFEYKFSHFIHVRQSLEIF